MDLSNPKTEKREPPAPAVKETKEEAGPRSFPAGRTVVVDSVPAVSPTHPRQKLTADKLSSMSRQEIRAIASDRGYDIKESTTHSRAALSLNFLAAQDNDATIKG